MIRRPPRSTLSSSSAASDVYKRQEQRELMDFTGRIALVTGSSSGIGAAIARELAAGGARVALNYRGNKAGAEETAAAIREAGGECDVFQADVGSFEEAASLVKAVESEFGRIGILVNNAGTTRDTLLMSMRPEDWGTVISTNCLLYTSDAADEEDV